MLLHPAGETSKLAGVGEGGGVHGAAVARARGGGWLWNGGVTVLWCRQAARRPGRGGGVSSVVVA